VSDVVKVIDLGLIDYQKAHDLQQRLVEQREAAAVGDCLLLVQHPHVFTRGRKSRDESDILAPGNVPLISVERGGEITYHGPGQIVAYPIFHLADDERDAPRFIRRLEQWIIATLETLGVPGAYHNKGFSGVWVGDNKIASVGVAVTAKWVTWHGIALNINTDLSYFSRINPCGLEAGVMTSVSQLLGAPFDLDRAKAALIQQIGTHLSRQPVTETP
jgi:lipoate-protein ligase B